MEKTKKPKLVYLGHKDRKTREIEYGVIDSFNILGYNVVVIDDKEFKPEEVINECKDAEIFLFHKLGYNADSELDLHLSINKVNFTLQNIKCKRVMWFVDKVWMERELFIDRIIDNIDYAFFTDETYLRRHKLHNGYSLKQGCQNKRFKGKKNPAFECDIAFVGSVYGERQIFVNALSRAFGDKVRVYQNIRDKDFADLCKSARVIVSPHYPMDDFYWSNRIYEVLSYGGLLLHPIAEGLKQDGIINGQHYIGYSNWVDVEDKLDVILDKKSNKMIKSIAKQGQEEIITNHTYLIRCKKILETIK